MSPYKLSVVTFRKKVFKQNNLNVIYVLPACLCCQFSGNYLAIREVAVGWETDANVWLPASHKYSVFQQILTILMVIWRGGRIVRGLRRLTVGGVGGEGGLWPTDFT